ncbi:Deoxyadenosine/deoxycytidine kinase [Dyadobacter sp. CECT 9275]|uniref:Deoxyadenosine/deoxycytidine kinase n=1 Tax=Dyadobacter helix TaxID=2822344 RepID=A0A916JII8_9BACT|nr:deoxynucleoside kinase [Dyadobacter sp. CECT 9275]CAG5016279.1 Deoxyadenosine/deoxycytidine kinase [Dyadobacter sp. CECT 9275]
MHIAIIGNIGAGKTTLTQMLGQHYKWDVMYEAVEGNPYLADFYGDMERWAFNLQVFFLNNRFAQVQKIRSATYATIIQDRTIYEDAFIFARNLYESGIMTERDYKTYLLLFESIINTVSHPDLLIYLKAGIPKLVSQIQKRGRNFEADISTDYLENLNRYYDDFSSNYEHGKILEIDVNNIDFALNSADFKVITDLLDKELFYV